MSNTFPGIGFITFGKDFNYYKNIVVSNTSFGGQSIDGYQPTDIIRFSTQYVIFSVEGTGTEVIEGSFNGTTVHFKLQASDSALKSIAMPYRVVSKFWLRTSTGSPHIVVQAW